MDEKIKVDNLTVKKLEYINGLLTDTSRFGDDMKGKLDGINKYLSSTVQLNKELNKEEAELVEKQMKMLENLGEYNKLLEKGKLTYDSVVNDWGRFIDLQKQLNEEFKTGKENQAEWSTVSKSNLDNWELIDEYMKDGNKTIADAKKYLKDLLEGTSKLRGNIAAANLELAKANSFASKYGKYVDGIGKGLKNLFGFLKAGTEDWRKFNDISFKSTRKMGLSVSNMRAYQTLMMKDARDFGVSYGLAVEDMVKFQQQYSTLVQRNIILSRENKKEIAAMHVLVGDDLMNTAINEFDKLGGGLDTATAYIMKQYDVAARLGLNAEQSVGIMNKNMGMMNKYSFKSGVNGFQRMAILSQQLRFNMEAVGSAIEKVSNLEGAIDMSASMQVLGGSYAAQFGNPLQVLYESLNDAEGFIDRVVNTFASKGNFNRETGMVEISAYNKAMMREAAKNLGISYEEALNMANQSGKRNAAMREINSSIKDKNARDLLANVATYNTETRSFEVTVAGMDEPIKLADIKADDIKKIKNNIVDDNLDTNVKEIRKLLAKQFNDRAKESVSFNENIEGAKTSKAGAVASVEDSAMIKAHEALQYAADKWENLDSKWKTLAVVGGALGIGAYKGYKWYKGRNTANNLNAVHTSGQQLNSISGSGGVNPGVGSGTPYAGAVRGGNTGGWYNGTRYNHKDGSISIAGGQKIKSDEAGYDKAHDRWLKNKYGSAQTTTASANASKIGGLSRRAMGIGMVAGLVGSGMEVLDNHLVQNGTIQQKGVADYALSVGGGALSGAATGAMIGSIIPVIGTGIGAAIGALAGGAISAMSKSGEQPVQPQPLDNGTAGQMVAGNIDLNVHGTIHIQYPNGASQDLIRELQRPDIQNTIKNIVIREMAKANAGGAIVNRGSQQMLTQGA